GGRLIVTDAFGRGDADPAPHVRFRARARWEVTARQAGLVPVAVMRYVSWLSRPREAAGFGWMSDIVRGAVEYGLEVVAPRPAHLRGAVFVRQRGGITRSAAGPQRRPGLPLPPPPRAAGRAVVPGADRHAVRDRGPRLCGACRAPSGSFDQRVQLCRVRVRRARRRARGHVAHLDGRPTLGP